MIAFRQLLDQPVRVAGNTELRHSSNRFLRRGYPQSHLLETAAASTAGSGRIPALQPMQNVAAFKTITVGVQPGVLHVSFDPQTSSPDTVVVEQSTAVSSTTKLLGEPLEGRQDVHNSFDGGQ